MALGKNLNKGKKDKPSKNEGAKKTVIKEAVKDIAETVVDKPAINKPEAVRQESSPVVTKEPILAPVDSKTELTPEVEEEEKSNMLVVFPVGSEEYAFEIAQIKEVVTVPPISPIPQTKSYIRGVANVRGNVLAVLDLARKFGLKKQEAEDYINYVIVIKSEKIKVALASSQVPETFIIKDSQIDSTADVIRKSSSEQNYIKGIIKKDKRMIIFIDVLEMMENEQPVNL
ncbi:MAG: chemotaxis protein CheW [Reichenbachiella sp.]|uniref:chemotaxis protein CheW n=1 Tax=Reichenbachiella sp. TaxID=2184521 RepID=UPI0032652FAF